MAQDWDNRGRWSRGAYWHQDDYSGRDRSRDWSDKAGDEMRSWFGDDEAERRRRMDEARGHGMAGSGWGRRGDDWGGFGGRQAGGWGYDPYGSGREDQGRWGSGAGYVGYGAGPGMMGLGAGMAAYGARGYGDRGYGDRAYGDRAYGDRAYGDRGYGQESWRGGPDDRGFFERAGDEIASWFGDEEAQRRREMDANHRGRGPRNYSRSDERIREDVSERLADDPHLDASGIEVSVSGGEVTLNGTVESRFAKRHAEDLAERCSGVTHVQNNLRAVDRQWDTGGSGVTASSSVGADRR